MVAYHAGYNLVAIFGVDLPFFFSPWMNTIRDIFAGMFILISGAACRYSRSNLKRGMQCFCLGMVMTLATWIAIPSQLITFGILHMLGISMILVGLLGKLLDRLSPGAGLSLSLVLFFLTRGISDGTLLFGLIDLPASLYTSDWLFSIGLPGPHFYSSDYFPLFPWVFLFLAGFYLGHYLKDGRFPSFFYQTHCRWLAAVGRHTIWIYLMHQPVIYGLMLLIFSIVR